MFQSLVEQSSVVTETTKAIEAETRGELETSLRLYDSLLTQLDNGIAFPGGAPQCVLCVDTACVWNGVLMC